MIAPLITIQIPINKRLKWNLTQVDPWRTPIIVTHNKVNPELRPTKQFKTDFSRNHLNIPDANHLILRVFQRDRSTHHNKNSKQKT